MAIVDLLLTRLGRPAGKALDPTIRDIVQAVLKEHGYASPAEVQALRDEVRDMRGRVDGMERRLAEVVKLAEEARAAAAAANSSAVDARARAEAAHQRAESAEARATSAEARAAAVVAAAPTPRSNAVAVAGGGAESGATASVAAASAAAAASEGRCKVDGCDNTKIRSRGLCNPHYLKWLRGTLTGFVGPEGHVMIEGVSRQVAQRYAAGRAEMRGEKLFIDGEAV